MGLQVPESQKLMPDETANASGEKLMGFILACNAIHSLAHVCLCVLVPACPWPTSLVCRVLLFCMPHSLLLHASACPALPRTVKDLGHLWVQIARRGRDLGHLRTGGSWVRTATLCSPAYAVQTEVYLLCTLWNGIH